MTSTPKRYRVVNRRIDTFVINGKGKLPEEADITLRHYQDLAKENAEEGGEGIIPSPWQIQGQTLFMRAFGGGNGWRYHLFTGTQDFKIDIGTGKLNGNVVKVRIGSLALHAREYVYTLVDVEACCFDILGIMVTPQVSEVHLCADIMGWQLTLADAQCFVSRGSMQVTADDTPLYPVVTSRGRHVKEFAFCKSAPHSADIYDKTLEVVAHHKQWFYDIWRENGWDGETVITRIEFRYERSCLHDMDIEDPYDLLERLDSLWQYSCRLWLRHTRPVKTVRPSLWEASPVWSVVQ
jgi:hypothetical protein